MPSCDPFSADTLPRIPRSAPQNTHGNLKLPFDEPGTLGNEHGIRIWKGQMLQLPPFYGPFDAIVLASCIGGNVLPGEALEAWLAKCSVMLRPGGVLAIQELELQGSKKWKPYLKDIEKSAKACPLSRLASGSSWTAFGVPADFLFDGAPLRLKAKVVTGFGRGSKQLGFPTANMHVPTVAGQIRNLAKGVYFGFANVRGAIYKTAVNVGKRPTFEDGSNVTIECHVIGDVLDDFYGEEMRVLLLGFLRPEMAFDSLPALVQRIRTDVGLATKVLDGERASGYAKDPWLKGRHASYSRKLFEANAKWTSAEPLMGWRHFRIVGVNGDDVEVMAVCDRDKRAWVSKAELKKSSNWQPGWIDPDP